MYLQPTQNDNTTKLTCTNTRHSHTRTSTISDNLDDPRAGALRTELKYEPFRNTSKHDGTAPNTVFGDEQNIFSKHDGTTSAQVIGDTQPKFNHHTTNPQATVGRSITTDRTTETTFSPRPILHHLGKSSTRHAPQNSNHSTANGCNTANTGTATGRKSISSSGEAYTTSSGEEMGGLNFFDLPRTTAENIGGLGPELLPNAGTASAWVARHSNPYVATGGQFCLCSTEPDPRNSRQPGQEKLSPVDCCLDQPEIGGRIAPTNGKHIHGKNCNYRDHGNWAAWVNLGKWVNHG